MKHRGRKIGLGRVATALVCVLAGASLQACAADVPDPPEAASKGEAPTAQATPPEASAEKVGQTSSAMTEAMDSVEDNGCTFIPFTCTWHVWTGCLAYGSCMGNYVNGVPICTTGCN